MKTNLIFNLSMVLNSDDFQETFDAVYDRSEYISEYEDGYIDQTIASKGIIVKFRDSTYKKKISLIVNLDILLDFEVPDAEKVIGKLNKRVSKYFNNKHTLDDFYLSSVSILTDINVGSKDNVSAYIKVLKRIGKVKGFTPVNYEGIKDSTGYCLEGNSNGVDFLMYDLERQLADNLAREELKTFKGIIRTEVKFTKKKSVSDFTDANDIKQQIAVMTDHSQEIFAEVFSNIIPFGNFYKMDETVEIIRSSVTNSKMKRRMLALVRLIPEKKSLLLAQKALNYRHIDNVMDEFAKINLSPVTISKRQDVRVLKNLYEYLADE